MVNRAQILKQLEPGLNAIFGKEYGRYEDEHKVLFNMENSSRAFEEDVLMTGFGAAVIKPEGGPVAYDDAKEGWVARYSHETIALAFKITEEAMEDNLYDKLAPRLTKALARSMHHTREVKAANVFNRAFSGSYTGGDGVALCSTVHPLIDNSTLGNTVAADLSETALENALIAIGEWVDDRGIPVQIQARKLVLPIQLQFTAERLLATPQRVGTADNDINAVKNMGFFPEGWSVNHRFTDPKAWFILTDAPDGMKGFNRVGLTTTMEGDFETGNVRYKARERYSFGWSDWRGVYGSSGT